MRDRSAFLLWLASIILQALLFTTGISPRPVWGAKPVLAHLLLDSGGATALADELGLSAGQRAVILQVARREAAQIARLEAESRSVLNDPALSRAEKRQWVASSGYNERVRSLLEENQAALTAQLGLEAYKSLVEWIEVQWRRQGTGGRRGTGERWEQPTPQLSRWGNLLARLARPAAQAYPRSFEVYATRYDAGERKIVALPDKCLKFANGGALQCDGYAYGQGYSVAISYQGNLVVALVGEAGPWNVDDNYWAKASDPQPRRMFADLPLGVPEAQAAYFNGYNGGLDQFGRLVTSPVAIDVSKALAADLGLGPGNNKVTVSFLWTEGWDGAVAPPGNGTAQPAPPAAIAWETAAPQADGAIIHTVQAGQTLVGIAAVYGVALPDLLALNGLSMQSIIQPGEQIIVREADPTPIPTATSAPTLTPTSRMTPTLRTSDTPPPTALASPSPTMAAAPQDAEPAGPGILVVIGIGGLIALALIGWGVYVQKRR